MNVDFRNFMSFVNFFLLGLAVLVVYYYAYRLRYELQIVKLLRAQAEEYKALVASTSDGVFKIDAKGRFELLNDASAQLLGYNKSEELVSGDVSALEFLEDADAYVEVLKRCKETREVFSDRITLARKNATRIVAAFTAKPRFLENGEFIGFEGIFRDVTDRVEMEVQLRQYSHQLEEMVKGKTEENMRLERERFDLEKLAVLGQAASTIVHEIRNPLSSVKVGLTTLLSRTSLNDPDKNLIDIAKREVNYMEQLLKEILAYSKPSDLHLIPQNINKVLDNVCQQYAGIFRSANVSLENRFDLSLPKVAVDFDKISQVFTNILLNASQAMEEYGGTLTLSTCMDENELLNISIKDTGIGMTEEQVSQIFTPFYSTKSRGTGLGMPLVKKIIEAHKGDIQVESKSGKGTKVTVILPFEQSEFVPINSSNFNYNADVN